MHSRSLLSLILTTLTAATAAAQTGAPASAAAPCPAATDARYGFAQERPVQVGGGPMYGAARQQRYLKLLRGPAGQTVSWERRGATMAAGDKVLDMYTVRYDGIEGPLTLFLDWYQYTPPMVPVGFGCGGEMELGTPPPDPFVAEEQLTALAAATVSVAKGPIAPIPLGENGAAGFVLDRFRVLARLVPSGAVAPRTHRTIVVINAETCGERRVSPTAITLTSPQGQSATPAETFTVATRFAALATGLTVPDGSLGGVFPMDGVLDGVRVHATFSGPGCGGEPTERSWPLRVTAAWLDEPSMPARPAADDTAAAFVAVQAVIDHAGAIRELRPLGGSDLLVRTAVDAIHGWRPRPATANGAPLTTPVVLMVRFAGNAAPP
jgi:hypothetical protein